jgi:cystathionine beta-lyase/cystathionine gamma-synthase
VHLRELGALRAPLRQPQRVLVLAPHAHITPEERAAIGIPDGFVRVSVGIENAEDIIADFTQALA